jgi:hypothetical protein
MATHLPLVQALSRSQQHQVKAGRVLFHGCVDTSQDTDLQGQRLLGSRKWLSEDAEYAVSYAYCNGAGVPLLWECRLAVDATAFFARQPTLFAFAPWGASSPWEFPSGFERHAKAALGQNSPVIFLDHPQEDGRFKEVLVPSPAVSLIVDRVHRLPSAKQEAEAFARQLQGE